MTTPDFLPPDSAYSQAVPWNLAEDPMVTPPGAGVNGWFQRVSGMFKRSWKSLGLIFVITQLAPAIAFAVAGVLLVVAALAPYRALIDSSTAGRNPQSGLPAWFAGFMITAVIATVILIFVQAAGYAAATFAATREAAGLPAPLGEALAYGFRRCAGLVGWQIVTALLIFLGVIACILPAFYVAAATALVGPIYLFERGAPISRSFRIFHNNLGRVLGRVALVVAVYYGGTMVVSIVENIANALLGSTDPAVAMPAAIGVAIGGALVGLPLTMFLFVGILLTYAEQRAYEAPTSAAQLAAEL